MPMVAAGAFLSAKRPRPEIRRLPDRFLPLKGRCIFRDPGQASAAGFSVEQRLEIGDLIFGGFAAFFDCFGSAMKVHQCEFR